MVGVSSGWPEKTALGLRDPALLLVFEVDPLRLGSQREWQGLRRVPGDPVQPKKGRHQMDSLVARRPATK